MRRRVASGLMLLAAAVAVCACTSRPPPVANDLRHRGGNFTLDSADGLVRLSDFRGDLVLLYFGYTHCADACPMSLGKMAAAVRGLPAAQQKRVQGLFVSLDPRRDTPAILKQYVRFYDPSFIGMTGSTGQLKAVAARWHVSYSVPQHPKSRNYVVEHSHTIYLLDTGGRPVATFTDATPVKTMRRDLRAWMPRGGGGTKP